MFCFEALGNMKNPSSKPASGGVQEEARSGLAVEYANRRNKFIDDHCALFWYTPEESKHAISDELLVETILNEGTLDDFRQLKALLSPERVAHVFFSASPRQARNYYPEIRHFFSLALKKYA